MPKRKVTKGISVNRAKVQAIVRLLRQVRCDNFRVVGAGSWHGKNLLARGKK